MTVKKHSFEDPRVVLKRYGFSPKKSWGQNFLISPKVVRKISNEAADQTGRTILEIGPGLGTLTGELLNREAHVTAIERDRDMCEVLRCEFGGADRFELVETDAKSFDYGSFCKTHPDTVITGNLPYHITGPLLRRIMTIEEGLLRAVVMVQEEVADRIVACTDAKQRGALSVMVQARFAPRIVMRIQPGAFVPAPKVRSAVVVLETRVPTLLGEGISSMEFDRVVKAAFSSRRKYLRNALISSHLADSDTIDKTLEDAGIDAKLRAEKLENEEFVSLALCLKKRQILGSP